MLLGMAIKYAGLRGKEGRVIGKNRSTLDNSVTGESVEPPFVKRWCTFELQGTRLLPILSKSMSDTILQHKELSNSSYSHVINAPIGSVLIVRCGEKCGRLLAHFYGRVL